ncbi:geminin coiled-coil domain-containing protein 1-like [Callospermophilus lateralis]|uniref:geminin coiled-coil domain-containing protein 1-like n=1 Tax=Callospermophilus lateralis TaxID=76772 RepID=UPI004054531C
MAVEENEKQAFKNMQNFHKEQGTTGSDNTILPCQDQYFTGDQSYNCPYSTTPSETSVDVSTETWVSFWAAGLLDNSEPQQAPQAQDSSSNLNFPILDSCSWEEAQLSSQLYRNKQLQETLVQKEEELARLHEENNHLRQYLNSTSVKCFEEKAKYAFASMTNFYWDGITAFPVNPFRFNTRGK